MPNKKLVPEIRFEGFEGEWEEVKLSDIFSVIRNAFVGTATPYYVDDGYFYLQSNNVKNGKINRNNEVFINEFFYQKQKEKWLHTGDIVMVQSGHVGHTAVIPEELNNTAAHALIIFTNNNGLAEPYFLNYQFLSPRIYDDIQELAIGNTIKHILSSDMKETLVSITDKNEQEKIGNIFKRVDELINLKEQEHEKIKQFKQAMLQKMFPKEGETVPEIRFEGFTSEWKEYTFEDVANVLTGLTYSPEDVVEKQHPDAIRVLRSSNINNNQFILSEDDVYVHRNCVNIPMVKKGQILMTASNGSPKLIGKSTMINTDAPRTVHGGFMYLIDSNFSDFINYWLLTENFKSRIKHVQGGNGSIGNLKRDLINNTKIRIPENEEQKKIGLYFTALDSNILGKQAELKKLKQFKQAMLDKMFV